MMFQIEQLAINPPNAAKAKALLTALGWGSWTEDTVVANGQVRGERGKRNVANLSFNYNSNSPNHGQLEFEVLEYTNGRNWAEDLPYGACHFGMHVTREELAVWRAKFSELSIGVAQEVITESHTNPIIAGKRTYNYVIFDTRPILGIDLKFIVRCDTKET